MRFHRLARTIADYDVSCGTGLRDAKYERTGGSRSLVQSHDPPQPLGIACPVAGIGIGSGGITVITVAAVKSGGRLERRPRSKFGTVPGPCPVRLVLWH